MDPDTLAQQVPVITEYAILGAKSFGTALVVLAIGWMVSKWTRRLALRAMERAQLDVAVARFLSYIAQYTVLAAAVIAALGAVGVETTSLVAVLASAGLAVGLALQGSLSNFASGVMILIFRPFALDDVVTVAGHTGKVVDIGLFATTMHTPDANVIIVPNSAITGSSIVNVSSLPKRRISVPIGVAYGTPVQETIDKLLEAVNGIDKVIQDPEPGVAFTGFGASSVDFTVNIWCVNTDFLEVKSLAHRAIYDALNEAGIDIPFNQIVVHKAAS